MNEAKEINAVQKTLAEMKTKLAEAEAKAESKDEAVALTESKLKVAQDLMNRKETLNELMSPLGKEKKEIMSDLLESVKTENLAKQFDKYLPSVLDGDTPRVKKTITESVTKEHTGDKKVTANAEANDSTDGIVEIDTIRKLAGLSK